MSRPKLTSQFVPQRNGYDTSQPAIIQRPRHCKGLPVRLVLQTWRRLRPVRSVGAAATFPMRWWQISASIPLRAVARYRPLAGLGSTSGSYAGWTLNRATRDRSGSWYWSGSKVPNSASSASDALDGGYNDSGALSA